MANSTSIRGVKIVLEGDASPLITELRKSKTELNQIQKYLNDVEKALKLDPKNPELLKQKFQYLNEEVAECHNRLNNLNAASTEFTNSALKVKAGQEEAYKAIQREIAATKAKIKECNDEQAKMMLDQNWANKFGEALEAAGEKIQAFGQKFTPISTALSALTTFSVNSFANFESAFTGVRKTVEATEEEFEALQEGIRDMASTTASSAEDIAAVMEVAGQLGIANEDLETFTKTMVMLGDTTNMTAQEGAVNLAKFLNITGSSTKEIDKIGAAIVDLGNNYATYEQDIVDMSYYLASAGTAAGLTAQDILGLATAMSSAGIKAAAGGSSMMKTLRALDLGITELPAWRGQVEHIGEVFGVAKDNSDELYDVSIKLVKGEILEQEAINKLVNSFGLEESAAKSAVKELDGMSKSAQFVLNVTDKLGVSAEEFGEIYKNEPIAALKEFIGMLGKAYDEGDSLYVVMDELGLTEIRQSNMLRALSISYENFDSAIETANKAYDENTALVVEANKRYKTYESHLSQAKEKMKRLGSEAGARLIPYLEKILDKADTLLEKWDKMDDATKDLIVGAAALGGQLALITKIGGPVISMFGSLTKETARFVSDFKNRWQIFDDLQSPMSNFGSALLTLINNPAITAGAGGLLLVGSAILGITDAYKQFDARQAEAFNSAFDKHSIDEYKESLDNMYKSFQQIKDNTSEELITIDTNVEGLDKAWQKLQKMVDENGNIKAGYEEQVQEILNELNPALGTSLTIVEGQVKGYKDIADNIDLLIAKKKAELYLNALEDDYTTALKNQLDATENLVKARGEYSKAKADYGYEIDKIYELEIAQEELLYRMKAVAEVYGENSEEMRNLASENDSLTRQINNAKASADGYKAKMGEMKVALQEAEDQARTYGDTISQYNMLAAASAGNSTQQIEEALLKVKYDFKDATNATEEELVKQAEEFRTKYEVMQKYVREGVKGASNAQVEELKLMWALSYEEISKATQQAYSSGNDYVRSFTKGLEEGTNEPGNKSRMQKLARDLTAYYHFSVPDKGPLADADKWGPDFVKLFADGIDRSSYKVKDEITSLASYIATTMGGSTKFGIAANGFDPNSVVNQYSNTLGGVNITINAAETQDVYAIANAVNEVLTAQYERQERAFAR